MIKCPIREKQINLANIINLAHKQDGFISAQSNSPV